MKRLSYIILLVLISNLPSPNVMAQTLSDSLRAVIKLQLDHEELLTTFEYIRKSKNQLDNEYIPLLKDFANHAKKVGYEKGEMKAYDFIGLQNRYNENFDTAYFYHIKSLEIATRLKDSTQIVYNYNNLGQVFRMQDLNALAIDNFHKALEVSKAIGNLRSASYTMNTIGATLVVQKDYERAMKYFQMSSEMARKHKDKRTLAYNFGNIGEIFLIKEQPDSAMYYFQISRDWLVELNSDIAMGVAEHLIGQAYFQLKEYNKAKEKFELALVYHINDNDQRYQSLCNCYLGKIATVQHKYNAALEFLDLAKTQALKTNSLKNLVETYDSYADLYKLQNEWEKAYDAKMQSFIFDEQIINEKNNSSIQALEIGFETKEKEQEIKLLYSENKAKKQGIILSVAISFSLLLLLAVGLLLFVKRKKQSELYQLVLRQQLLRSQMNPHFLFNALGSIQNFMYKNETKKAAGYLGNFASLTRAILEHSSEEFIPLSAEIETLHNYIKLEQMRVTNSFEYSIEYDEELDTEFIKVPPMLIQPFIENAIKHGLKNIDYQGFLIIQIEEQNTNLHIKVIDNGFGINTVKSNAIKAKTHRSMSMQIFKERRDILSQRFKKDVSFKLTDRSERNKNESGTEVLIVIPV